MDEINTQQPQPQDSIADAVDQREMAVEEAGAEAEGDTPMVAPLDFMAVVNRDVRAAHFLVDLLGGCDADEAVEEHFGQHGRSGAESQKAIDEAEQRGYLRGLNERAEASMAQPVPYDEVRPDDDGRPIPSTSLIGTFARPSVWDIE